MTVEQTFDAGAFIAGLESRGIRLQSEGEQLHVWPSSRLTEEDRAALRAHKRDVLVTLPQNGDERRNGETATGEAPAEWDQAEADRLLAELRAEVERVNGEDFGGAPPALFRTLAADLLAIGEGYVRGHDAEAARGWDALELLRGLFPLARQTAAGVKVIAAAG